MLLCGVFLFCSRVPGFGSGFLLLLLLSMTAFLGQANTLRSAPYLAQLSSPSD